MRGPQQFDGAGGQGIALPPPELPSDIAVQVLGLKAGGVQDHTCGVADFLADAITG